MNRRSFIRNPVLGAAGITLAAKLRLDPGTPPPGAERASERPRYEWITGPILTRVDFRGRQVLYGQAIDWSTSDAETIRVIPWAKLVKGDPEAFREKYRSMWPCSSRHSESLKDYQIALHAGPQAGEPFQGPIDPAYYEGLAEYDEGILR